MRGLHIIDGGCIANLGPVDDQYGACRDPYNMGEQISNTGPLALGTNIGPGGPLWSI